MNMTLTTGTFALIALASSLAPGNAQAQDHAQHQMPMPPASSEPAAAKPADSKPADDATAAQKPAAVAHGTMDHSTMGHDMPAPEAAQPPPAYHSTIDHSAMDHGATPMPQAEPMQGMDHSAMDHDMPTTQPREPIPQVTDADRAAAFPDVIAHAMHDDAIQRFVMINRLEAWDADPGTGMEWEGQAWIGTDLNRLWLRSEGERVDGDTESADLEVLYGRSVARWWDVVAGVRHDFKPGASQDFAAFGVIGLAPQMFEIEATAYVGERGQTAARFEAEREVLLTNRLILQPLVEVNLFGKDDRQRGIGSGLSTAEVGLRLRYEFTRKFAPYIGVVRERAFGGTADFRRLDDEDIDDTRLVIGLRTWF